MPRPKVERVARALRLPTTVDAVLVEEAGRLGLSVNTAIEQAVISWTGHSFADQAGLPSADDVRGILGERGAWRNAEGALKGIGPDEPAEVTIRRIRGHSDLSPQVTPRFKKSK